MAAAASQTAINADARARIKIAFETFNSVVTSAHRREFDSATPTEVWTAAREVETKLAARESSRNLRRIKPFLEGLERYSAVIEVLCNGTPYLPWIWGPIKLCLMIASDFIEAFEKLIKAYGEIADVLPRFHRLSKSLEENQEFQQVVGLVYCDIIKFHKRAYKVFTDSAWKRFFDTTWKRFDHRFGAVLASLRGHADLVDKEASAFGIVMAQRSLSLVEDTRQKLYAMAEAKEKETSEHHLQATLTWLHDEDFAHEDDFHHLLGKALPGTYSWFLDHRLVKQWYTPSLQTSMLWVHGKPGSGKSVLCVQLIECLRNQNHFTTVFQICSFRNAIRNNCSAFLRGVLAQIIRRRSEFATHVYYEYICKGLQPSLVVLKPLLRHLAGGVPPLRVVLDGLDECPADEQKSISLLTNELAKWGDCKIIVFSQEIPELQRAYRKQPFLSLGNETFAINQAIGAFARHGLKNLQNEQDDLMITEGIYGRLQERIIAKAEGMFLWVQLVLSSLEVAHSLEELEELVERLPKGLENVYARILDNMQLNMAYEDYVKMKRIFTWIALAERPLREREILCGITLASGSGVISDKTRLQRRYLDLAKPFIETTNRSVTFVHFTVRKYLLASASGPLVTTSEAMHDISLACARSMSNSLDFVDTEINDTDVIPRMLNGAYGLHNYASDYWGFHLKQYDEDLALSPGDAHKSSVVIAVNRLAARHEDIFRTSSNTDLPASHAPHTSKKLQICAFSDQASILLGDFDRERTVENATTGSESKANGKERPDVRLTLFPQSNTKVEQQVQALVNGGYEGEAPHTDAVLIKQFRDDFADVAFVCHTVSCSRRIQGFTDDLSRLKHEETHSLKLHCPHEDCVFASQLYLDSTRALRRHISKYHTSVPFKPPSFKRDGSDKDQQKPQPLADAEAPFTSSSSDLNLQNNNGSLGEKESQYSIAEVRRIGGDLEGYQRDRLPGHMKVQGDHWFAVLSPLCHRELGIENVYNLVLQHEPNFRNMAVRSISFSLDGKYAALCCGPTLQVFDLDTGWYLCSLQDQDTIPVIPRHISAVCFGPSNEMLATGCQSGHIMIWHLLSKIIKHLLLGHASLVRSMEYSSDGRFIASISDDHTLMVWYLKDGIYVRPSIFHRASEVFISLSISADSYLIAAGLAGERVRIWNSWTGKLVTTVNHYCGPLDSIDAVKFSSRGHALYLASQDGTVGSWQLRHGSAGVFAVHMWSRSSDMGLFAHTAYTPDEKWIISDSTSGYVRIWNFASGVTHLTLHEDIGTVTALAASPRNGIFATGGSGGKANIWRYKDSNPSTPPLFESLEPRLLLPFDEPETIVS